MNTPKKYKKVTVFDSEGPTSQTEVEPPTDATYFVAWITKRVSEIPAEHIETAEVRINGHCESDSCSCYGAISIGYYRPETSEEVDKRLKAEKQALEDSEQRERRTFEILKRKFETVT